MESKFKLRNNIKYPDYKHSRPLKYRLIIVLVLSSLIPLILLGGTSLSSLFSLVNNQIENGIYNNLNQIKNNFDNILNQLDYSSKLLALDGSIGNKLSILMEDPEIMVKYQLQKEIIENIELMSYGNPNLGIIRYYSKNKDISLSAMMLSTDDFYIEEQPLLAAKKGIKYFGPHQSIYEGIENEVFSIVREVNIPDIECYVYIESGFGRFRDLIEDVHYGFNVKHIIINNQGKILYSELPELFVTNLDYNDSYALNTKQLYKGHYIFGQSSQYGWTILTAIEKDQYDKAVSSWLTSYSIIGVISIIISLLFGVAIWRMVSRPLNILHNEITLVSRKQFDSDIEHTNVEEFDEVLDQFQLMRKRIVELINEVKWREKAKRELEVEMLMHQINPHFLHNTLNSIQWLAKMNGQTEIDDVIRRLTRLLHYNLEKNGNAVTLEEEIKAVKTYLKLLQVRYDYEFVINVDADEMALKTEMPRFILQPLVENCLFHGLSCEEGKIEVNIKELAQFIRIVISDNGNGMNPEKLKNLFLKSDSEDRTVGFGIGLEYVQRMLKTFYDSNKVNLNIESKLGEGTRFIIYIPTANLKEEI
ncbi:MAG: sensor histidine kinase [Halanaerobiales bacterium]